MPTRFPGGVTTASPDTNLNQFGLPAPMDWHVYFNDFDTFVPSDWVITTTEAGTGSATEAITDEDGGVLLITNDDAGSDSDSLQLQGETFLFEAGKKLIFRARFKTNDADDTDITMGLQITDTSPLAVTDGVYFLKIDNQSVMDLIVEKDDAFDQTTNFVSLSDNTFVDVGFYYNGSDKVIAYINNEQAATLPTTNIPDDEVMTVGFSVQNGSAAAKTLSVDYIFCAKER